MHLLQTIGAAVVVLGVLIFVHELGHFLAAKSVGIAVLRFSFGFGPVTPLTITRGEFTRAYMRICAEAVHRCVPGSSLVVIPNARHAASAENPAAFNEALLRFLAAHQGL